MFRKYGGGDDDEGDRNEPLACKGIAATSAFTFKE
jgi:hypothetical protein